MFFRITAGEFDLRFGLLFEAMKFWAETSKNLPNCKLKLEYATPSGFLTMFEQS